MKILHSLAHNEYLYMLHHKNPVPLIDFAKEQNYQVIHTKDDKGQWHILISRDTEFDLNDLLSI